MTRSPATWIFLSICLSSCAETQVEYKVLHRSACEVCHRPLDENQMPNGIEESHPWSPVSCTDCHGGKAFVCDTGIVIYTDDGPQCDGQWVYDINASHIDGPDVRGLSSQQLDALDPAYLRFINPGDPRVVAYGCGGAAQGGGCHTTAVERMTISPMRHIGGLFDPIRTLTGRQNTVGTLSMLPDGTGDCALIGLERLNPQAIDPSSSDPEFGPTPANVVDHVLAKSCSSCHLDRYGTGDAPGLHRSSGCSACHSTYDEDGLSKSNDPWVDKTTPSHPVTHALAKSPHTTQCASCHHYSEAIGLNYQGLRRAGSDEPDTRITLGRPLYGLDADGHITDENSDNEYDETPPDVHFSAGMHCADCHTAGDAHGPDNPTLRGSCAVTVKCEDCHGSVRERATEIPHLPRLQVQNDAVTLQLAIGGKLLDVPQIVDAVNPESKAHNPLAERVMGIRADGRSHTDDIACQTCHAAWLPSQYGQFATLDLRVEQTADTTGILTPGGVTLSGGQVATNDLVLGIDSEGRLRPTIPSGRWFFTLLSENEESSETASRVFEQQPLIHTQTAGQTAAFTQRPVDPHTTTLRSGFAACNRCHTQGDPDNPLNGDLLDITFGAGSNRFNATGCDVERGIALTTLPCDGTNLKTYRLDALYTPEGALRAIFEWGSPVSPAAIERMREVVLTEDAPILLPISATDDDRAYPPFIP